MKLNRQQKYALLNKASEQCTNEKEKRIALFRRSGEVKHFDSHIQFSI